MWLWVPLVLAIQNLDHVMQIGLGHRWVEGLLDCELASSTGGSEVIHGPVAMRITRAGQGKTQSTEHGARNDLKLGEGEGGEGNEYHAARNAV